MNINGISNSAACLQQFASSPNPHSEKPSQKLIMEETIESTSTVAKERPFYEYQEEPWLTDPRYEEVTSRKDYAAWKSAELLLDLGLAKCAYDSFMKKLIDTNPELASKKFGITLGADATIKIIDYDESLTDDDRNLLVESLSRVEGFQLKLQSSAKGIMTLLDHDHETFRGRYNLDIDNFQFVIDFRKIFTTTVDGMQDDWVLQVQRNADLRDSSYTSVEV